MFSLFVHVFGTCPSFYLSSLWNNFPLGLLSCFSLLRAPCLLTWTFLCSTRRPFSRGCTSSPAPRRTPILGFARSASAQTPAPCLLLLNPLCLVGLVSLPEPFLAGLVACGLSPASKRGAPRGGLRLSAGGTSRLVVPWGWLLSPALLLGSSSCQFPHVFLLGRRFPGEEPSTAGSQSV